MANISFALLSPLVVHSKLFNHRTLKVELIMILKQEAAIIAEKIIELLEKSQRTLPCDHEHYHRCLVQHVDKLKRAIHNDELIEFVLPAFPAKSRNTNKTYGTEPDLGEQLALEFLNGLCKQINQFYTPGAKVIICSDGRVFNDLLEITDAKVARYANTIKIILSDKQLAHIELFALDDYYQNISYVAMRHNLTAEFSDAQAILKQKIKTDTASQQQFNGIHRFIFEDNLFILQSLSRNKVRNLSKDIAYQVVQRSNAWSALVEKNFPNALRLSIHPQPCGSNKIGIMLLKAQDNWATPWHRVVLYDGHEAILIKKCEAEALGAKPVFVRNQFSHYSLKETCHAV